MFDSLVIHLQDDAYYLGGRSGSLSWWNHGHSHATAELYEGKDSWISSLGSNKIRSLHNAVTQTSPQIQRCMRPVSRWSRRRRTTIKQDIVVACNERFVEEGSEIVRGTRVSIAKPKVRRGSRRIGVR